MKKNGFTMIELIATITILGILATIAITSFNGMTERARKKTYMDYEKTLKSAAVNYFIEHDKDLPQVGGKVLLTAPRLLCENYLETLNDPKVTGKNCNKNSYILVERKESVHANMELTYQVCLSCERYQSPVCKTANLTGAVHLAPPAGCTYGF